jgi:hypothetical protein
LRNVNHGKSPILVFQNHLNTSLFITFSILAFVSLVGLILLFSI